MLYIGLILFLIIDGRLLPSIVIIGAFIVFILWLVGLVIISIELWGPSGSVNSTCQIVVFSQDPHGVSDRTFAWMMQKSICKSESLLSLAGTSTLWVPPGTASKGGYANTPG